MRVGAADQAEIGNAGAAVDRLHKLRGERDRLVIDLHAVGISEPVMSDLLGERVQIVDRG